MKARLAFVAAIIVLGAAPGLAQQAQRPGLGEVVVTGTRQNASFAQQDRPVVGLRRQADAAVMQMSISSDTRDEATRKREIHTVLLSAMDRAKAAGFELVFGNFQLVPVTRANYQELPFQGAGRVDTSKVDLRVKLRLGDSATAASKQLTDFIKSIPASGRAVVEATGVLTLTIVEPDQYRDEIVRLVAADARHNAGIFGPDFTFNITGIDGQISWSQVSSTEVFLYLPYRYTIVPK